MPFKPLTEEEQRKYADRINAAPAMSSTPAQSGQDAFQGFAQQGMDFMSQTPPAQIAKQAFEGASNVLGAVNPWSTEDLGQRAGRLTTGTAQFLSSPAAPVIEMAKKAPDVLKSGAIMGLQGLKKGMEGFQGVVKAGETAGEGIRRGDIGMVGQGLKEGAYGALKSTSGAFTGAAAPFAGAISGLPDFAQMPFQKIGEALEGSKEFLRSITGTTDTPEGDAIGDSIDVALGLLPLLPKAKVTTVTNKLTNSFTSPKAMMSELNGELRQSPKLAERNYNTQSFYTNISKNGFFDEYATSLVKKVGESIKELPNRLGTYVERYAEKGKGTVLDEAVADMNAVHGEVYKNLGKSVGNQSAIIENSLPIFDSIEGIARSNLGKSPIVKKLLDIRQVLDNNGSIQDLVNARTTIEDMLSKPKDKFTSTNTQLLAKLHDSIGSDLQSTMRAIGGEMSSVADDLASSTSTFRETMNTFFADTAPTVEALPKSAQGLGMLDDATRGNAQKPLLKAHMGADPFAGISSIDKSDLFNILDDVQKAEMQRYSALKNLGLPDPRQLAKGIEDMIYKVTAAPQKAAQGVKQGATYLGQEAMQKGTMLPKDTIKFIYEDPNGVYGKLAQEGVDNARSRVFTEITDTLRDVFDERKSEVYRNIESTPGIVKMPKNWFDETVKKELKVTQDKDGNFVKPPKSGLISPSDIKALNQARKDLNFEEFTPAEFLANRKYVNKDLAKFEKEFSKSETLEQVGKKLYAQMNDIGRKQIQGLDEADAAASASYKALEPFKGKFFTAKGEVKPTFDPDTLQSLMNKSNKEALKKLDELRPGTSQELQGIKVLDDVERAMSSSTGASLKPLLFGSGFFGSLGTANIPGAIASGIGYAATNPKVFANVIHRIGKWKRGNATATPLE